MKKQMIILGLCILLFSSFVNAQGGHVDLPLFEDVGFEQQEFNYNLVPSIGFGVNLTENEPTRVEFRTFAYLYSYTNSIYMKVIPSPSSASPQGDAYIEINCVGEDGTFNVSIIDNWINAGWAWTTLSLWSGNYNQSIRSSNNESTSVQTSTSCILTARNQDMFVTFYDFVSYNPDEFDVLTNGGRFSIPNQALASLVTRTSSVVNSLFYVVEIGIMILALIFVVFVPVFIYKMIKYFAKRKDQ